MWRSKKLIVGAVLVAVVLLGSMGGIALAQTENGEDSQPASKYGALLDRVCEIYEENTGVAINPEALKDAFTQVQDEVRTEALENRLQSLVDQGKMTRDEADQYLEWQQSKPDVPAGIGFRGHGKFHGMRGMRGFGGPCAPAE